MADDADTLAGMYYGLSDDAQRQAMANALRGSQQMQGMGALGQAFGQLNPGIGALGQEQAQAAAQRMAQMERAPMQGVSYQKGAAELADLSRRRKLLADPNSALNQVRGDLWRGLGGAPLPEGFNTGDLTDTEYGIQERSQAAKENAAWRRQAAQSRMGPSLDPAAVDLMVENAHMSGALPQGMGRDKETQRLLLNAWAAKYPGDKAAIIRNTFHANEHALGDITTKTANLEAFANTAASTADQAAQLIDAIPNLGSTTINAIGRKVATGSGSPEMARFWAAHQSAVSEVAKVLSGGSAPTDNQRAEAAHLLNESYTPAQYKAAVSQLKAEMSKRISNLHEQADVLRGGQTQRAQPGGPQAITHKRTVDGITKGWNGKEWVAIDG